MEKRALLIGVGHYGEGLAPIPSAPRDVDALAELLRDPALGGFDPEAVMVLKDPARTEMETAVEALFANRAPDDLLLLYFSGHGLRDEKRELFLACRETEKIREGPARGRLRQATALRARTLQDYMQASPSKRQLVILDCCFSGAMAIGMTVKDEGRIDLAEVLGGEGRAVLTSSAATELSQVGTPLEGEPSGNGEDLSAYTRFLVEGIRTGAADRQQRGCVDAEDLHDYVKRRLGEVNPAQTPEFYPTRAGHSLVVSRVPRDPTVEYRKKVQSLAEARRGAISPAGRILLDDMAQELGLPPVEAQRIEAEVLQPFRDYDAKLERYRQALETTVAALPQAGAPLSSLDRQDLLLLETRFKLRGSDVAALHQRLGIRFEEEVKPPASELSTPPPSATHGWLVKEAGGWQVKTKPVEVQGYQEALAPGVALTLLRMPAGTFLMGSPQDEPERSNDEGLEHEVKLGAFFLGQTPITQAQWLVVAGWGKVERDLGPAPSSFKGANRPVEQVSWFEAVEFCRRLSQRTGRAYTLPSEAQWEYGCRAGTTTPFHFGATITPELANYNGNYTFGDGPKGTNREQTTDVGSFPANDWGLQDMHGNVWDWCLDHWHDSYKGAPGDGSAWLIPAAGPGESRLLRGGSWDNDPRGCRSAYRYGSHPGVRLSIIGFRVCCLSPGSAS